jgi:hypothetical protein
MWTNCSPTPQDDIVFSLPTPPPSEPSDDEDEENHAPLCQPSLSVDDSDEHHKELPRDHNIDTFFLRIMACCCCCPGNSKSPFLYNIR